jgi:glyoxylase-like metal-dependent hydrolase (beta-lactamase superfamily II)
MRIHHLNCATMCPPSQRLINGYGSLFAPARMVCHCLAIETDDGIVLIDTGLGLEDVAHPAERLHAAFRHMIRPILDPEETAVRQLERLGFQRQDVRHIIPTHLDVDHAGGLPDFPDAVVHIFADEYAAVVRPRTVMEQRRYHRHQWAHQPRWSIYEELGEQWFGFPAVRSLKGVSDDILLVPLPGHTRGHCGVAVRQGNGWLLHAGDAYFHRDEVHGHLLDCPPLLAAFQMAFQHDAAGRIGNLHRLRQLAKDHRQTVTIISAHDPDEFDACRSGQTL